MSGGQPVTYGRTRHVQANVQASLEFRLHENVWDYRDETPGVAEWLNNLMSGDEVHLLARALYPGWTNFVVYARLDIYIAL